MTATNRKVRILLASLSLLVLAPFTVAQGVGSGGFEAAALPATSTIGLSVAVIILSIAAFFVLRKRNFAAALVGPTLVLAGATAIVASPELRAQMGLQQFTNPNGEYISVESQFAAGIPVFEFTNVSGQPLKIVRVQEASPQACLDFVLAPGKPQTEALKGDMRLQDAGFPDCMVGETLENGATCRVDFYLFCTGYT